MNNHPKFLDDLRWHYRVTIIQIGWREDESKEVTAKTFSSVQHMQKDTQLNRRINRSLHVKKMTAGSCVFEIILIPACKNHRGMYNVHTRPTNRQKRNLSSGASKCTVGVTVTYVSLHVKSEGVCLSACSGEINKKQSLAHLSVSDSVCVHMRA